MGNNYLLALVIVNCGFKNENVFIIYVQDALD